MDQAAKRTRKGQMKLGEALPRAARAAFRRYGFVESAVLSRWPEIVGPSYASCTLPIGLKFAPGKRKGATLSILVDGPIALQLKHVEPQVLERINGFFGYKAVERLALRQGEVPASRVATPATLPRLTPGQQARIDEAVGGLVDLGLKTVIERIGARVLGASTS
jgi:hypothetical protein